ncbi:MAG: hypothetical protein QOI69_3486 [Pseudonocardiales bacterium]|nr:hypothetical protein [Pseudonocardiales bacterium]
MVTAIRGDQSAQRGSIRVSRHSATTANTRRSRTVRLTAQIAGVACAAAALAAACGQAGGSGTSASRRAQAVPFSATPTVSAKAASTPPIRTSTYKRTPPHAVTHREPLPAATAAPAKRAVGASTPSVPGSVSGSVPPVSAATTAAQPGPSNTGVPAGTALKVHNGDLVITTAGATYDALDIRGFVTVRAPNVTIKRSIIRGGVATRGSVGLVTAVDAHATNLVLQDSTLVPAHPSVSIDGVTGANYTLTRVDIYGTVDGAKVLGDNVTIQNSWIHDTTHYAHDPAQGNGPSHNDAVQVLGGRNVRISGNTVRGGNNAALQITQGSGVVAGLAFTGNWADGGACTVNVADTPRKAMSGISVSSNRFGHTSGYKNCAIIVSAGVSVTTVGNTWVETNTPVAVTPGP